MLNRALLMKQMQQVSSTLFVDIGPELSIAYESWQRIIKDPFFVHKIRQISTGWLVPDWYESLNTIIPVSPDLSFYCVASVDGSQVYPDRHQGTSCFLVNIGSVQLHYGPMCIAPVLFDSQPLIYTDYAQSEVAWGPELVNCLRQELELENGLSLSKNFMSQNPDVPFAFLFDGSFIFWHLESKDTNLKDIFLKKYLSLLDQLYQSRILCAGYISLPKSKELVNLIRIELCKFKIEGCKELEAVSHLVDTSIARFFLPPNTRSIVFKSNAQIGQLYPDHLKPHFFYCNVGTEIVRIEIPAWIAADSVLLEQLSQIILNQVVKGRGYPVALAEAHEQAVVKGPDREFFYHLITKLSIEKKQHLSMSQKSIKKRGIGI